MIIKIPNTLKDCNALFDRYNVNTGYLLNPNVSSWFFDNNIEYTFTGRSYVYGYSAEFTFSCNIDAMAFKLRWL